MSGVVRISGKHSLQAVWSKVVEKCILCVLDSKVDVRM